MIDNVWTIDSYNWSSNSARSGLYVFRLDAPSETAAIRLEHFRTAATWYLVWNMDHCGGARNGLNNFTWSERTLCSKERNGRWSRGSWSDPSFGFSSTLDNTSDTISVIVWSLPRHARSSDIKATQYGLLILKRLLRRPYLWHTDGLYSSLRFLSSLPQDHCSVIYGY